MPTLIFVGMVGPGLLGMTAAKADPDTDGDFIAAITERGFTFPDTATAIGAAGEVCDYLDAGDTHYETGIQVAALTGFDITTALYFIGESVTAYCPEHTIGGQVRA
ncbi:MAG: DUF732 domain-containing protein [Mycobacterium sp.]